MQRVPHVKEIDKNFQAFFSLGLIWHNGEAYLALRRFSLTVLKDLGVGSLSMQQRIQARIPGLIDHIRASEGAPFSPRRVLQDMVTDVLSSVIFGRRLVRLFDSKFVCLFIDLLACLYVCLSVCKLVSLSYIVCCFFFCVYVWWFVYLSACLLVCLFLCSSVCRSVCLPVSLFV